MIKYGSVVTSPGGSFQYIIQGPVCRLYDREELPWPCCRIGWKGKEPSWNRIGRRFVPDMGTMRFPSYSVIGADHWGVSWTQVYTVYDTRLKGAEKDWWYCRRNERNDYPTL